MHVYIVKTRDGYLYPFAGDMSLTDEEEQAGWFGSADEARASAERMGYIDDRFQILSREVDAAARPPGAPDK
jgi:hypothetical protein